jgi:hypothetical protein
VRGSKSDKSMSSTISQKGDEEEEEESRGGGDEEEEEESRGGEVRFPKYEHSYEAEEDNLAAQVAYERDNEIKKLKLQLRQRNEVITNNSIKIIGLEKTIKRLEAELESVKAKRKAELTSIEGSAERFVSDLNIRTTMNTVRIVSRTDVRHCVILLIHLRAFVQLYTDFLLSENFKNS